MSIFFGAFIMIFLAEMGDKSQIMAFSLASRYSAKTVLLGVFFATLINNGAAVFIGTVLGDILNIEIVTAISAIIFLGFGAWVLLENNEENNEEITVKSDLSSFFSVVSLFTIAEMGDKTQIATAVYAATYNAPFLTLGGVLLGMLLADGLGIYLGVRLRNIISRKMIKAFSSIVFFILGGINFVSSALIPPVFIWLLLIFYVFVFKVFLIRKNKEKN